MTQHFVTLDVNGYVEAAGFGPIPPDGAIIVDANSDHAVLLRSYVNGANGLVARPLAPEMTRVGNTFSLQPSPAATQVLVYDLIGEELLLDHLTTAQDEALVVELQDAGSYHFEITAPLPYLPRDFEVQV